MPITDIKFTNNARTLLSTGSLADDDTSVSVDDGSVFPALSSGNYFYATLERASDSTTREIVKVTARSGNNLTIVRAQDNTSATTFSADDVIELRVVAKSLEDIRDAIGTNTLTVYKYTATAGQTTFTGSDDASATLAYTVGNLFVTVNGITLENGTDYAATNGTSVVLTNAATVSDELNVYAFAAFDVSNVTQANGDFSIGDDLTLGSDGAIINFGADSDVTLTHVADTGLLLNSTRQLQFNDASQNINAPSATVLDINATDEIELNATLVDVNANLDVSGTYTGAGHISPSADSTYDLGANGTRFRQAYIDEIDVGSNTGLAASSSNAAFFGYAGAGAEYCIECKTDASTGTAMYFLHSTTTAAGSISVGSSATAFNTSSDYRLKENVSAMSGAITRLKNLKPKRFNWISDENNELLDGFLAHEGDEVVPQAIHGEKDATKDGEPVYQGIDQSKLVPLLTGALQEAITEIEALKTRIKALEDASG